MLSGDDSGPDRVLVALLVIGALVLVSGVGIGVVASGASGGSLGSSNSPSNDTTVQQRNPDEVGGSQSLSALERQLADRVSRQIESGAVNLSRGQYDQVRDSLSDSQYESLLNRYTDVASQTGNENQSRVFRRMRDRQRAYATAAERYWRLYDLYNGTANVSAPEYQRLVANLSFVSNETINRTESTSLSSTESTDGATLDATSTTASTQSNQTAQNTSAIDFNTSQRRQLARQLQQRWRAVDRNGTTLIRTYREFADLTAENYSAAIRSVQTSRQTISRTQLVVRERWLIVVNLSARTTKPNGSFVDPIEIAGRLTTANGTPIRESAVTLDIAGQPYRAVLNQAGEFAVSYRPTTIPMNATNVSVKFVPTRSSAYTSSPANVSVAITQATPNVSVRTTPDAVGFNETLRVSGQVGADDTGAANVPYLVTLDNRVLDRNTTALDGSFDTAVSIPATIQTGEHTAEVSLLLTDQALAPANASTAVTVQERPSELSLRVAAVEGRSIRVAGRLYVPGAGGVTGERVRLIANGTDIGSVRTGASGRFNTTVLVPASALNGGLTADSTRLRLQAAYDNDRSNVRASVAQTRVTISQTPWLLIGGATVVLIVGVLAGGYLLSRRVSGGRDSVSESVGSGGGPYGDDGIVQSDVSPESLIALAREQLDDGRTDVAVRLCYAAMRTRLEAEMGAEQAQTPWEFYQAVTARSTDSDVVETLRSVTELYERAVFASEAVSVDVVESRLARVSSVGEGG